MEKQTVLVTGAAGFIGYHLSRRLLEAGQRVVGFDCLNDYYDVSLKESRLKQLKAYPNFLFIEGDLADEEAVNRLFNAHRPEVVVNLAAQAGVRYSIENPGSYMRSNMMGFFNLLEAVRANPVRHFVFASSSSVYGNRRQTPFRVEDPVDRPISLYAATKKSNELMAYTYAHLFGVPATGVRFFTVYGPYGRPDMAYFSFTKKILAGTPINMFNHGELYRDFTYVDDVVDCLMNMLPRPPAADEGGDRYAIYNVGNSHPEKLTHFIEVLEEAIGKRAEIISLPMQPGDVYVTSAEIEATSKAFGFVPKTSIEEGIPAFVRWYKAYYHVDQQERTGDMMGRDD